MRRARLREIRDAAGRGPSPRRAALALALAAACAGSPPAPRTVAPAPSPAAPSVDVAAELAAARAARVEGNGELARRHLETVVLADPRAFEPRLDLAELLLADGSGVERAALVIEEARALRETDARLWRLRGSLLELRQDEAGAADAYALALAISPDAELRLRRGMLLAHLGQRADAAVELERVEAERPSDRAARAALAELYETDGRLAEAEGELAELARLAPAEAGAQRRLAAFHRRHGDPAKAREAEERARQLEAAPRALRPLGPARH